MSTASLAQTQASENLIFRHGVASGDPLPDRVLLWTRVTAGTEQPVAVRWSVARDEDLRQVVASGTASARPERDHTLTVDVTDLQPATPYFFRFEVDGQASPVGRTKTLPAQNAAHARFAQLSCAKFNAGFFNAYGRLAERADLDFVLHLGDYIYEASNTPPASQTPGANIGRPFDPLHECKTLDDYRRRYAQYHLDPDVQRVHAALPFVTTVDDHELADGAWRGGASEHKPDRDGPWEDRVAAALRARSEWLPVRLPDPLDPHRFFRTVSLGGLADVFMLDTRSRRDEPVGGPAMHDPARSALGATQRAWLAAALRASRASWRVLGNPSVLASTWRPDLPAAVKPALLKLKLIDADGAGPDYDQWDGYPVERQWLLRLLGERASGNVAVLSGDVHVGLAIELKLDPFDAGSDPVAVEMVNSSITSQNLDDKMGWAPRTQSAPFQQAIREALPHIRWCDLDSHGYSIVDVTPERLAVEWWAVDTVLRRSTSEMRVAAWQAAAGNPRLTPLEEPLRPV